MASSFASTASSAIASKAPSNLPLSCNRYSSSKLPFSLPPASKLRFLTKGSPAGRMPCPMIKAQLNEVAVDDSSIAAAASQTKSQITALGADDARPSSQPSSEVLATEESISEFITQVASLIKLVDSRDIVELKLKQLDCEVTIRKKEAVLQLSSPAQVAMVHSSPSPLVTPVTPASTLVPTAAAPPNPTPAASPPALKSVKSSHPPLKCPMAGTFYRSPAPSEPPFVKVGDKVKKGQVVCIIEAMKLMNEIEADQSGTVVDILVEDGKLVSVDTPLFVIEP